MAHNVDRRASTASTASQRTISTRRSSRVSYPNIFSDDSTSDSFMVADGFRPSPPSNDTNTRRSRTPPRVNERRSLALQPPIQASPSKSKKLPATSANPLGIVARNSFSLRHDAQRSDPPQRMSSMASTSNSESPLRPLSTVSNFTIPRSQSPFVGASAPSHPYGMYHQDTAPEGENDPLIASTDIASVGFPGLRQQYARRLGPDGEDADDIIGPDGHTEQLPPYTRWPDRRGETRSSQAKERIIPTVEVSPPSSPDMPWTATPTASMSDALLPGHVRSDGDATAVESQNISPEIGSTREKWTVRSKKRTCFGRLPYWLVCLLIIGLVLVAAFLGVLIGRVLPKHSDDDHSDDDHSPHGMPDSSGSSAYPTAYATIPDATPLSTMPAGLPLLPTGSFGFPIKGTSGQSSNCLVDGQRWAWDCSNDGMLDLNVTNPVTTSAQLSLAAKDGDNMYSWGPQPPILHNSTGAIPVLDMEPPNRGPAYYFQQSYDKIVIVPNISSSQPGTKAKRWTEESIMEVSSLTNRGDGSQRLSGSPWFCFWNHTMLEGFIYINQTNPSLSTAIASAQTMMSSAPASGLVPPPSGPSPPGPLLPGSQPSSTLIPMVPPSSPLVSVPQSQPSPPPKPRSDFSKRHRNQKNKHGKDRDKDSWHGKDPDWNKGSMSMPSDVPGQYPKLMKILERRIPGEGPAPYCQQMNIDEHGNPSPKLENGMPIKKNIEEAPLAGMSKVVYVGREKGATDYRRRDGDGAGQVASNSCLCEWLSG